MTPSLGYFIGVRSSAPEHAVAVARAAEAIGIEEVWTAEDYFLTGSLSLSAMVLASTERLTVGIGLLPVHTRHPAVIAMETSTIERAFPGRFVLGLGTGVTAWQDQMGLPHGRPLGAVRESTAAIRALQSGEELTTGGQFVHDRVRLAYPSDPTPIYLGAVGPRMLEESGRWADGTIVALCGASPEYLRYARHHIDVGAAATGRTDHHPVVVLASFAVDDDSDAAVDSLRPHYDFYLARTSAKTDVLGISDELTALLAAHPGEGIGRYLPAEWIRRTAIAGTPEECRARIRELHEAGADRIILHPAFSDDPVAAVNRVGTDILGA